MANLGPIRNVEKVMCDLLSERGWTITDSKRKTVDLDLFVEFEGTPGRIIFRNGFDVPKGTSAPEPDPCFVRVDLGEPKGEPERWAVWDFYSFPTSKESPSWIASVFHEAIGPGWASVTGNSVDSRFIWSDTQRTLSTILAHAESLNPSRDEAARRNHILQYGRVNVSPQRKKTNMKMVGILLALNGVVPVIYCWSKGGFDAGLSAAIVIGGIILGILALIGLGKLIRRARKPKKPIEGMNAIAEALKGTGAFETFELLPHQKRERLPVVVLQDGYLDVGGAPLWLGQMKASSQSHGITLEADLCHIKWPESAPDEARLVPDSWLLVELSGSSADLAKLPPGRREDRKEGHVRWLITGEELAQGEVERLFASLAASFGAASGPYR